VALFNQQNNNQVLLHLQVQALPLGGILRKNVKDEHLAAITRPPYLSETAESLVDQTVTISLDQAGRNSGQCEYWMGVGESCAKTPADSSPECQFRSFVGPLGVNKWDYVTDNKFLTFEGALVEVTLFGTGSDLLPLHIQSSIFQVHAINASEDLSEYFAVGSWRDTLPPLAHNVTLRFYAVRSAGETMFGTSFLPQQDKGVLDSLLVLDFMEFQSLTPAPTNAPTVTPDDDLIGPLDTMWIAIIVAGVVVLGMLPLLYSSSLTLSRWRGGCLHGLLHEGPSLCCAQD
jgi:hypothetical protein